MSLALKQAKFSPYSTSSRAMQGDPGLFGFLGSAARTVSGAVSSLGIPVVSGVAGIANRLMTQRPNSGPVRNPPPSFTGSHMPALPPAWPPNSSGTRPPPMMQAQQTPGVLTAGGRPRSYVDNRPGGPCPGGMHRNKHAYWRTDENKQWIFVDIGCACVRNRRRNPLNPRAASRAISRLKSTQKAIRTIDRQFPKRPANNKGGGGGRRRLGRGQRALPPGQDITVIDTD